MSIKILNLDLCHARAWWKTIVTSILQIVQESKNNVFFLFRKDRMIIFRMVYEHEQHMTTQHSFFNLCLRKFIF